VSNKERTKIRRNNYRGWKQAQKQKSATPASPAAPALSVEPAASVAEPPVAKPKVADPVDNRTAPDSPRPGASIPFNPSAPADLKSLYERLRYGGPDVTDEERIAIARRMERHAANTFGLSPEEIEDSRQRMRAMLTHALNRFGIRWPPAGEPELAPSVAAPGHSTGPRTPAGKDRSSQNARTHGLSSLTSIFVLLDGEDPNEWVQLVDDLNHEFQPASRTERILVNDMAQSHWLTQRAINLQTSHIEDPKAFALYLRYQTTHHRAYFRALKQLMALQKGRAQSGAPAATEYPESFADSTLTPDTVPLNPPDPAPVAPQPDTSPETMTLPQAA
jgi:hypothetical protein